MDTIIAVEVGTFLRIGFDDADLSRRESLVQHAADQGSGHVAAADETDFQGIELVLCLHGVHWFLGPKMAEPILTIVAPSAIAAT